MEAVIRGDGAGAEIPSGSYRRRRRHRGDPRGYIIDEDLYDMIIAARPGDQPRKIETKDAMEDD